MTTDDEEPKKPSTKVKNSKEEILVKAYYLGSSESPGNIITPIKLRGAKNYNEWSTSVRRALISKRKFEFVDGTIQEPTYDPERLADLIAVHSMLVSWIKHTLDDSLRSTVGDYDDARALWVHLKKRFCVVSGTRVCQLKMSLGDCRQTYDETITEYHRRPVYVVERIGLVCTSAEVFIGSCKYNIAGPVANIREENFLHHFLIGLDIPYEAIRAQLLAQTPLQTWMRLPTCDKHESLRKEKEGRGNYVMAFKVDLHGKTRYADSRNKFCNHCNRVGHDEETCYQLHGFPEWWDPSRKGVEGLVGLATGEGVRAIVVWKY